MDLLAMLQSGELARLARATGRRAAFYAALGMTEDAYVSRARRLRRNLGTWPSFEELLAANDNAAELHRRPVLHAPVNTGDLGNSDFADEDPTDRLSGNPMNRDLDTSIDPSIPAEATPPGHYVKGVSTLWRANEGAPDTPVLYWTKTATSQQARLEALLAELPALLEPVRGRSEPVDPPHADDDLLAVYPLGDPHLGLHVWHEETGENFDLEIAERDLCDVIDRLVDAAPRARRALLINLGDFIHADSNRAETTKGTRVDVDTRWHKVMRTAIRTKKRLIERLKERHELVEDWNVPGNHDAHSSVALSLALQSYYENDPRVTINSSPGKFFWYRFGRNLIGSTHGDTVKMDKLGAVMACDRAADWGETFYRYWYTGHLHHDVTKELPGVIVETFRTLAASDAWHHASGYRSGRDLKVDTIHREFGRIARSTVSLHQIRAARSA